MNSKEWINLIKIINNTQIPDNYELIYTFDEAPMHVS